MTEEVLAYVALGISIFAVALAMVFYFKSDSLYKEMLKFVTEIRTYSLSMYKHTVGMVKEAWPQVWKKGEIERISEETKEEKQKIKEDIRKDIMAEITKIKQITGNGIKPDQLKTEIARLEQKFTKTIEEAFGKIQAIDRKREKMLPPDEEIERAILEDLTMRATELGVTGIRLDVLANGISSELGVPTSLVIERIFRLSSKGVLTLTRQVGSEPWLRLDRDKFQKMRDKK